MALQKFQTFSFKGWKGLTLDNHLGTILLTQPERATNLMIKLLAHTRGRTLETMLSEFPVKYFDDDTEYYWNVIGSARKNVPLIEARTEAGVVVESTAGNVGANTTPFYLVFGEDYFANGEVIGGNYNQYYPMRILEEGQSEGTNTIYKVELMGGNTEGIPAERLQRGERFSVDFAPVEQSLSRKVGDVRFSSPITMRNEWTTIRIQAKVGGNMDKKLAVGIPVLDENGKPKVMSTWMMYVDYELEMQFQDYKNNAMAFGTSNRNSNGEYKNIGKSGLAIKTGAGLFEQMEVANTFYYNDFSLKLIEDAIYEIVTGKVGFEDRKVLMKTGERGAALFSKAVAREASGWSVFNVDNSSVNIIKRVNSKLHSNALSAGYQFTEYLAPNGVVISVEVDPLYDDPVRNKILHPLGGVAMSYRFDIMSLGSKAEPNIFRCAIKNQGEARSYQWGLRNPFTGQYGNMHMSYDEDSAVVHKISTLGICVLDPTKTMSIIPAILQG